MKLDLYQVDAFSDRPFGGNPAAICPLDTPLDAGLLQHIAAENNLSETAYFWPCEEGEADYHLRWFTPKVEVDLCGHATLATAHILFAHLTPKAETIKFLTASGVLTVTRRGDKLAMDFPLDPVMTPIEDLSPYAAAFGSTPLAGVSGVRDDVFLFKSAAEIAAMAPDLAVLRQFKDRGFLVTAIGNEADFVARCFFPNHGIDEDPATGSAYTILGPFWRSRTGESDFHAVQMHKRRADLWLSLSDDRIDISGHAVEVMRGTLIL